MKTKSFLIYLFFLSITVLSFLVSFKLLIPRFVWINESVHSTFEAFGAISAIFTAVMLLHRKHEEGGGRLCWMAIGLLSMGLLIGFHSVASFGHGFVLLHSVACFSGGFWFSLVWLPEFDRFSRIRISKWIPWIVAAGSVLFGVWTLLFRETLPLMVEDGKFTHAAILLNFLAGVFFLAATGRFLLDFHRSGKMESFLFSCITLLFGLANLCFPFSTVWDNIWWFWHLLRVLAFLLVLWFVFKSDQQMISTLTSTIVERERKEEELRETRDYLGNLLDYANAPIIVWDPQFRITRFNHAFESLTGRSTDEVTGKSLEILFPPDMVESSMELIRKTQEGERWKVVEIKILHRDGSVRTVLWNSATLFAPDGKTPVATIAQGQDITERKQAEEALKVSEIRYRRFFESGRDGILIIDAETRMVVDVNLFLIELLGFSHEAFLGKKVWELGLLKDTVASQNKFMELLQKGYVRYEDMPVETADGRQIEVEFVSHVYLVNDHKVIQCNIRDITERRKFEAQLRQSQKMESIGTLTGGIAHDFNNILTAIIGYASVMQMKMPEDDPLRVYLEHILTSSERAAVLTQSLLAFSRKQISNPEPVNLNEIIRKGNKFLSRVIGEDIELKMTLSDKGLTVMADAGQIEQVLMNLATNARDAMPKGGVLTIQTEPVEFDSEFVKAFGYGEVGKYACIIISDTGIGMNEATKEKIFEPFFTTKEVGKGTGLGLSMVYGIIKQHNGYINCYSESGKGTTFKIYLPLFESMPASKKGPEGAAAAAPAHGTETILLAEDEESVRKLMKAVLEADGYKVIEAADGEEAVSKFMENKDKIDILLLDIVMPKMSGREVYERIKKIKPDIKLLMASGYPEDYISKNGILEEGLNFVAKPMSPTKLLKKVREVLDK